MKIRHLLFTAAFLALSAAAGLAAPMTLSPYALSGNTESNGWLTINASIFPGTGGFPGMSMWAPLGSTTGGDAGIQKVSNGAAGGPYVGSSSKPSPNPRRPCSLARGAWRSSCAAGTARPDCGTKGARA